MLIKEAEESGVLEQIQRFVRQNGVLHNVSLSYPVERDYNRDQRKFLNSLVMSHSNIIEMVEVYCSC
jgi:hypothetical protein